MSIALDFALFMRDTKTKLGLSLAEEGVAYKLGFLSDETSDGWISFDRLLIECYIGADELSHYLSGLAWAKIIEWNQDTFIKRYRFNQNLINYHQLDDSEKAKIVAALEPKN